MTYRNWFSDTVIKNARRSCLVCFVLIIAGAAAFAQPNTTLIPYLSAGYKYQQVAWDGQSGFELPSFDDVGWPSGDAGFGTSSGCPLNNPVDAKTPWGDGTDMLIRKHFTLPAGSRSLRVGAAIDNDIQVYVNGQDISGGMRIHENCAERNSFVFTASDGILIAGDNVLAVRGRDRGGLTYLDVQVTADLPVVLIVTNTLDAGAGSLRDALTATNTSNAIDTIKFNIPGAGVQTIIPASALPVVTKPVVIDGTTQSGFSNS
ncbi:MAG: hypothetical protein ABI623_06065, partial [bacterium]